MKKRILTASLAVLMLTLPVYATEPSPDDPCTVTLYRDADHTEPLTDLTDIDPDEYVYYGIDCDDGFICHRLQVNAEYADGEKILFGERTPEMPKPGFTLLGDSRHDRKLDLGDVDHILKYIAGYDFTDFIDPATADVNWDGQINLADAATLLKMIAKWDIDIPDGVAENMEILLSLDHTVVERTTVMDERNFMIYELSVISSTAGLEKYITDHAEMYRMDSAADGSNDYTSAELRELYGEEFFAENELVIYDFTDARSPGEINAERLEDTLSITIMDYDNGVPFSAYDRHHKLIPVSRDSGIDIHGGIRLDVLKDFHVTDGFKFLYDCYVAPVMEEMLTVNHYE